MKKIFLLFLVFLPSLAHAEADYVSEIHSCTQEQEVKIREAEKALALRLDQVVVEWAQLDLASVKRDYVVPENRVWMEGSAKNQAYQTFWVEMGNNLRLMKQKTDRGLNFQCNTARDRQCADGSTIAYVMRIFGHARDMIYLCPSFFTDGSYSTTIFHELSHLAANTEDYALDWWNTGSSDLKRGAKDAYQVEKFMNHDVRDELRKDVWTWWWPRPKP